MPRILPIVPRKPGGFREASWTRGCPTRASTSARPDFRPRAWTDELPPLDAFATLIFQVAGQQLSVASTRAIITHLQQRFEGHMPSPAELLAADPKVLRDSGFSSRKGDTLRALSQRFVDGRLSEEAFAGMTDPEIEAALTESPGSDHGQRAASCWSPSTGPTCSSRATRRFDARSARVRV
ncbi:MAG: hypothetical protein ACLQRH_16660 [Acidimicrobiales bacterium]